MAVPTQLSDLSATAASNSPAGGDTVGTTMDDFIRAHASIIARISAGTDALATPNIGAATGTSLVLSGLATVNGAFTSRGIDDNATAVALTLSGSGANSITIANSVTNPTIGTSAGALLLAPATGFVQLNGATTSGLLLNAATGNSALVAMYVNGTEVARIIAGAAENLILGTSSTGTPQVSVTHTASADRYITLTGSNGGNPTIGTSGGSLNFSAAVVCASTLSVSTNAFVTGYAQINSATATPAGGAVNTGVFLGSAAIGIYFGSGAPTVSAAKGSLYLRSDGTTTNNRMYVNTNGGTTWTAVTTAA